MKNIHLLPTDKPSRLIYNDANQLCYQSNKTYKNDRKWMHRKKFNICITINEEIKVNDYITDDYLVWKWKDNSSLLGRKKVILSTDQDLIKNGVQAIDDEFLEWFVNNPSCEFVEVENQYRVKSGTIQEHIDGIAGYEYYEYKIIIPQQEHKPIHKFNNGRGATLCGKCRVIISEGLTEELYCERCKPKQETLEEAAKKYIEEYMWEEEQDPWFDFMEGAKWQQEAILDLLKVNGYKDNPIFDLITEQLKKK